MRQWVPHFDGMVKRRSETPIESALGNTAPLFFAPIVSAILCRCSSQRTLMLLLLLPLPPDSVISCT